MMEAISFAAEPDHAGTMAADDTIFEGIMGKKQQEPSAGPPEATAESPRSGRPADAISHRTTI
ncbi:hypothetical protein PspLS_01744 [Pyricularia sp. CBS 133598]|nr:hypothetical protein PspLS_01744 [Pyricularia sp. CBS 133598]